MRIVISLLLAFALPALSLAAPKKKKKSDEDLTQTHEVAPDPPLSVTVETARMEFLVSPLSGKGLLSAQTREALKVLRTQAGARQIVKIRAFVAGTGDQRRVAAIVSESFNDKKLPIPAVSTVQVGLLPMDGAQVLLEAVVVNNGKKIPNPNGLAFLSGMGGPSQDPPEKLLGMLDKAIGDLTKAIGYAGGEAADMQRVTCLLSSVDTMADVRARLSKAFPQAVLTAVQAQRGHDRALAECEGVARLRRKPAQAVEFLSPADMSPSPTYSKLVLVNAPKVVLTGSQLAFHSEDKDVTLAFQRMAKVLEAAKSSMKAVVFSSVYPLSNAVTAKIRAQRFQFYDAAKPPASTLLLFEGLPSIDASFGLELVAIPEL